MYWFSLLIPLATGAYTPDLVANLPGLNFIPTFNSYSGYLRASSTKMFHYWLTESMKSPSSDPLLLWLNGGPGCSSVGGLIEELGPFKVSDLGQTVYFNPYAWNTFSNVIFLESPAGVGYSYSTDGNIATNDDEVALNNYNALVDFLGKFPEYRGRDFYITGESYGGVYLPTLAEKLVADKANFPNFKGMAIGNGALDFPSNYRTMVPLYYFHGLVRDELYITIRNTCCNGNVEVCDIFGLFSDPTCRPIILEALDGTNDLDPYNLYTACYLPEGLNVTGSKRTFIDKALRRAVGLPPRPPRLATNDTALPLCAQTGNTETYMNRADVRKALHIPSSLPRWTDCSDPVEQAYGIIYFNVTQQIEDVSAAGVKILIYNGDVDTVCNHVMNEQFLSNLNRTIVGRERVNEPWRYAHETPNVAGFALQYTGNIDFVTVRGSGHFVPEDKPREALQMIYNWIHGQDYSLPVPF